MIIEKPSLSLSSAWCKAQTLKERINLLSGEIDEKLKHQSDPALGEKRLQRWREQPQFSEPEVFAQRVIELGIDDETLQLLLGLPDAAWLQAQENVPPWLERLSEAYAQTSNSTVNLQPGDEELGFLELVQPLVDQACEELAAGVREIHREFQDLPFDPRTIEDVLLANLLDPLLMRMSRTLVLELNIARLQEELSGDTPLERFFNFIDKLRDNEQALAILADYPVLARQLVLCIVQWKEVCLEFIGRLGRDWPAICSHFWPNEEPGVLEVLAGGAGDTHRGGRSVMIARFTSGLQIVYKPKSLAVDIHFQDLVHWLNDRGCDPPLRGLAMLDCGDYGWVEFIENRECSSLEEIQRFYKRLGGYLALLYGINGSDFHLENLIACGEQPMLIDLETLFNPEFDRLDEAVANQAVGKAMQNSVLMVGMLPQRVWGNQEFVGIDISGLGGEQGQLSPDRLPRTAAIGTDEMHIERERVPLEGDANRPRLNGEEATALDYIPEFLAGFRSMYRLLMENRADLLADNGPLAVFDQDEIRVLIRATHTYDQLLFESFHPDTLRDAVDRGLLLDRLWVTVGLRPFMANLVSIEQQDMLQGDIPVFTTQPCSKTLYSAMGEAVEGVLVESGMAITRRRIAELNFADMRRQEWFIKSSLAILVPYSYGAEFQNGQMALPPAAGDLPRGEMFLEKAREAADYLAETAVLGSDDVTWLSVDLMGDENWDLGPVSMELYNGLPGIALFLAYAGAIFDNEGYTDLARRAATTMRAQIALLGEELPGIGAFAGWGGILYTLTHLSVLWQDESLRTDAEGIVDIIGRRVAQDEAFSLIDGAAGAVLTLLAYYRVYPSEKVLETAVTCGDHLLAHAQETGSGLAWSTPLFGPQPLAGFGNGASGIAWALVELGAASGEDRFALAAERALVYERGLFSVTAENWPDLRQEEVDGQFQEPDSLRYPVAWCFGATGIGLARLRAWQINPQPILLEELGIALETTLAQGFGHSHCLCHGDLGNIELFIETQRVGAFPEMAEEFSSLSGQILQGLDLEGPISGGPNAVEMPGLMLGTAGIGYQLLRLAEPERVPSVLTLAPPTII